MGRDKRRATGDTSPTLDLTITPETHARAVASASGGCLIADAIKVQYPHLTAISVDMATIRVTDRAKGKRYIYLTPPAAQHLLLSFDQGWAQQATETVRVRSAVQVTNVKRTATGPGGVAATRERREQRQAELQLKVERGEELTQTEKMALTKLAKPYEPVERPASAGPVTEVIEPSPRQPATVIGGRPPKKVADNPNLLTGRNRHFGAKLADPGQAFREAVAAAVAEQQQATAPA